MCSKIKSVIYQPSNKVIVTLEITKVFRKIGEIAYLGNFTYLKDVILYFISVVITIDGYIA